MRASQIISAAALICCAVAEFDYKVLSKFPSCAIKCSATTILPTCTNITDLPNCLCTSGKLQYDISVCVIGSCNVTDQYASLTILQEGICKGFEVPSRVEEIRRAFIVLAVFTYPIIALRFISRIIIARKVWWDDWLILGCVALMIPFTVLPLYPSVELGMGKHFYNVPPANIVKLLEIFYAVQLCYVFLQVMAKISILLLYLRIFPSQEFRRVLKLAIAFMTAHGLGFLFAVAFQCLPVRSIWDREIPNKCVDLQAMIYAGAGLSIFEDFAIMLLPVFELRGLNLSLRKRVGLVFMFALGSFACVTSIVRIKYLTSYGNTVDQTWNYVDVAIWSSIETFTAVICACLMCIRPLVAKFMPSAFPLSGNHSNSNKSWGRKVASGSSKQERHLRRGGIELSAGDKYSQNDSTLNGSTLNATIVDEPTSQLNSHITVTTESRISFESKRYSEYMLRSRDMDDNETMSSQVHLNNV